MGYCSEAVSRKLRILSFLATVSVVIIHTNHLEWYRECPPAWIVGNIIAYLQRWAVPFFFVVSGFFLEREFRDRSVMHFYPALIKKKARTLLVPYLLWPLCYGLAAMTLLKIGVAVSHGESDIWRETIFAMSGQWWGFVDSLFGITHAPIIGALWYLRLLIITMAISPLLIVLFRYARWLGMVLSILLIMSSSISGIHQDVFNLPLGVQFTFKVNSLGWILLGMGMSAFSLELFHNRQSSWIIGLVLWIVFALLPLIWDFRGETAPCAVELMHRVHPVFTLVVLWKFADWASDELPRSLPWILNWVFGSIACIIL